ncbi:MAG: phosphoenolpyruvate carboxykinase domain-containing protein, partial [Desulfobacterota bacterium]|nr:phosphoenolpyruvate carboxykinase domain-containing protein [Thermodesulfobacteriota bacterium]
NVEKGMFGIIQGVNSQDDPLQWKALHSPGEIIFSNVLVTPDRYVHWIGKDGDIPPRGENFSGEWFLGKKDANGKEIPCSHPNARFTIDLARFDNLDSHLNDPEGVEVGGIVYGGRDSDTSVPVEESFDWVHGIITKGAALESETTAATLGQEGIREFNPMSNLDFLSISVGAYIQKNLDFGQNLKKVPKIFGVNYFLRDREKGNFLNEKTDKKVWYKWMELRVHNEVEALKTPTGLIPRYDDLKRLFNEVLKKEYLIFDYKKQFMTRIPENLAKIARIKKIYETMVTDTPKILFEVLEAQRRRLLKVKEKFRDYVDPEVYLSFHQF